LRDASLLREQLAPGRRILLIGGGVIGMELAASARQRDCEVVVLERAQRIMERALCPVLSDYLVSRHESEGVEVMTGVEAVCQSTDVPGVQLRDGRTIRGDAIVIGVGVAPNTELASEAGLFCEDGICVDAHGETSAPDVFAAGDVVSYPDSILGRRVRGENWMHAKSQAACVARGMVGAKTPYREVPHLWSDQFDLKIQVSGSYRGDRDILRGSLASKRFMIFHVKADHVVGASGVNQARDMKFATKLVDIRARVDAAQLADPNFDLKKALQQ
jgi:NADPH-dependent 2,4-dienoyl-CoA reductase/sulfur reductase-like enzyme